MKILEDKLDTLIHEEELDPLDACLYLMEQYLLEDGVRGQDKYQDALGEAWHQLREAYSISLCKKLKENG